MVLAIVIIVTKLSVEDSHLKIAPVCPAKVNVPELLPLQTVASAVTEPATVPFVTVIVAGLELASVHVPFLTTARYFVVWVKLE